MVQLSSVKKISQAGLIGVKRIIVENQVLENSDMILDDVAIEDNDFQQAILKIQPTAKREGFAVIPDTNWDDIGNNIKSTRFNTKIGALVELRKELEISIILPISEPEKYAEYGI